MSRLKKQPPPEPDEEALIRKQIAEDDDDWEPTEEELKDFRPFREVFPELAEEIEKTLRGRPPADNPKQSISIRLDRDVVEAFKAGGRGWQSRMNAALRRAAGI